VLISKINPAGIEGPGIEGVIIYVNVPVGGGPLNDGVIGVINVFTVNILVALEYDNPLGGTSSICIVNGVDSIKAVVLYVAVTVYILGAKKFVGLTVIIPVLASNVIDAGRRGLILYVKANMPSFTMDGIIVSVG